MGIQDFNGFPGECVKFYRQLNRNNTKVWFLEHKKDFDRFVLQPSREFVTALGDRLEKIVPGIHAEPMIDRSIFRIYRDIRFSKDKTPFKTHLALWFWEGEGPRMECSGFYFHLEPGMFMLGTGIYRFPGKMLKEYRDAVVHPVHGIKLVKAFKTISKKGSYNIGGKHYKRTPRGYDPEHKNSELLLYNGLYAGSESKVPDELYSSDIIDYCLKRFREMLPLHQWLNNLVSGKW